VHIDSGTLKQESLSDAMANVSSRYGQPPGQIDNCSQQRSGTTRLGWMTPSEKLAEVLQ
jgi:hypothetical protein